MSNGNENVNPNIVAEDSNYINPPANPFPFKKSSLERKNKEELVSLILEHQECEKHWSKHCAYKIDKCNKALEESRNLCNTRAEILEKTKCDYENLRVDNNALKNHYKILENKCSITNHKLRNVRINFYIMSVIAIVFFLLVVL